MAIETRQSVAELCLAARDAARVLAQADAALKDRALHALASALEARTPEILEANARDLEAGRESGLSAALMDRLGLDEGRVGAGGGWRRCPPASARSSRSRTRSGRCWTASACPTGSTCARSACRSAWWPSS